MCINDGKDILFPQCKFSLEFPEILSQNLICYHWLSVSVQTPWCGNNKIMHCGILINMPLVLLKLY